MTGAAQKPLLQRMAGNAAVPQLGRLHRPATYCQEIDCVVRASLGLRGAILPQCPSFMPGEDMPWNTFLFPYSFSALGLDVSKEVIWVRPPMDTLEVQ